MDPITIAVQDESGNGGELSLASCPEMEISSGMWQELADRFAGETTLLPYPADVLARRWREGYSAVAVSRGHIISHISLAPIALRAPGLDSWATLTDAAGISEFPNYDVYEFRSSWTDPAWRGRRISPALHSLLDQRWMIARSLGLSGMLGHASPTLGRLGWQDLAWDEIPYVSSLIAVPGEGFPGQAAWAWRLPQDLNLNHGTSTPPEHLPPSLVPHCWVSNPAAAVSLNQDLHRLTGGNLSLWRRAVVSAFCNPQSVHKLVFIY